MRVGTKFTFLFHLQQDELTSCLEEARLGRRRSALSKSEVVGCGTDLGTQE